MATAAILVALAACTGTGSVTPAPTSGPTAAPSIPGDSFSPSLRPSVDPLDGTATSTLPDVPDWGTGSFPGYGSLRVADARVAGDYRTIINWGAEDEARDLQGIWGIWVVWNDGGTWDGPWAGTIDASSNHVVDAILRGSGDYAGLALHYHGVAPKDDRVWTINNTIEPTQTSPPPSGPGPGATRVTGTRSCGTVAMDAITSSSGDLVRARGEADLCTWAVSDARLTGLDVTLVNADVRADGSAEGWGSISLRVGDDPVVGPFCGWVGAYTLHRAADGAARVAVSLSGVGSCAGLSYHDVETGAGDSWMVDGWLAPGE